MKTFKEYTDEWWKKMSPEAQDQYKRDHPKSEKDKTAKDDKKALDPTKDGSKDTPGGKKAPAKPGTVHKRKVGGYNWLPAHDMRKAAKPEGGWDDKGKPIGSMEPPYGDGLSMMEREYEEIAYQLEQLKKGKGEMPDNILKVVKGLGGPLSKQGKFSLAWEKAMKNAKTVVIDHKDNDLGEIQNTDAGGDKGIENNPEIEVGKRDRVLKDFEDNKTGDSKKDMHKPIMFYDTATGEKYLLAGNTRLTHGIVDKKVPVPVTVIEYDSTKKEEIKTFGEYITEANRLWNYLYGKHKGVFYRGEGRSGKGTGLGALGAGIYLTWSESMADVFATRIGSGGTVKKYKVKRGLKIADVAGKDVIASRAKMGFGPNQYGGDAMYANLMTRNLKELGYQGVVSDEVAEGIVIFDKKNIKEVK